MKRSANGFTIVELLIVIVVIGILAAITIVAYNGIQNRANDTDRGADVASIQRALELYKIDHGTYPPSSTPSTIPEACPSNPGTGYSYSFANDGSWLKPLVDEGYMSKVPVPSENSCTKYYRYLYRPSTSTNYGCSGVGYYILEVQGASGAAVPADSATFKPCDAATVYWGATPTHWTFGKFE